MNDKDEISDYVRSCEASIFRTSQSRDEINSIGSKYKWYKRTATFQPRMYKLTTWCIRTTTDL